MSRYEPLKQFLSRQSGNELPLSFKDVEQMIRVPLPKSAREYRPWWANNAGGSHVQAQAWLEAGWRTERVDMAAERVVFVRRGFPNAPPAVARLVNTGEPPCIDINALSPAAARLLGDYTAEMGGDVSAALARAVHEAAKARRARVIDQIVASAPRIPAGVKNIDNLTLIHEGREERDGR